MTFRAPRKLTEHFSISLGLALAAALIFWFEGAYQNMSTAGYSRQDPFASIALEPVPALAPLSTLTSEEVEAARIAWRYFETFTNPATGLSNSVETFPSGTMWDQGSYLMAILAAYRLGLITGDTARNRTARVLQALRDIPLVDAQLPNKVYSTNTLEMTFYNNAPTKTGLGWSALDMGRISTALHAVSRQFPDFADEVIGVQNRWAVTRLVQNGELWGTSRTTGGVLEDLQEGRLGYEEYGARGLALLGLNAGRAADWRSFAQVINIDGTALLADRRDKKNSNGSNYVLSEPFLLTAFEFGLDPDTELLAGALYLAQERRAKQTGILTAVTEDNINQDPFFLYYSAYANGETWVPINPAGDPFPELATVSTKAAFGWHALYRTEYTQQLMDYIGTTQHPEKGWQSGRYEVSGAINDVATANTNAMVLLSLHYRAFGPLLPAIWQDVR
ncbi:MAG: DUF3131 domain-containing protein [Pseudomonadota bacterium]